MLEPSGNHLGTIWPFKALFFEYSDGSWSWLTFWLFSRCIAVSVDWSFHFAEDRPNSAQAWERVSTSRTPNDLWQSCCEQSVTCQFLCSRQHLSIKFNELWSMWKWKCAVSCSIVIFWPVQVSRLSCLSTAFTSRAGLTGSLLELTTRGVGPTNAHWIAQSSVEVATIFPRLPGEGC